MPSSLHRFTVAAAACALAQITVGALVTSKEAGLSIPDWPLAYGRLVPQLQGGIVYEFAHRILAVVVALLTWVLAVWLWRSDSRMWVRPLGFFALGGIFLQICLGGMAVLMLLPPAISSLHASLAQILFALLCVLAVITSEAWTGRTMPTGEARDASPRSASPRSASLRPLAAILPALTLLQIALGAAARHKAIGYIWHIADAALVSGVILWATVRVFLHHAANLSLRRSALILISLLMAQIFLGIAAYMSRLATADAIQPQAVMVFFTALHVIAGALMFAATTIFAVEAWRGTAGPSPRIGSAPEWASVK